MNRLYNWSSYFIENKKDKKEEKEKEKEEEEEEEEEEEKKKKLILLNQISTYLRASEKRYKPVYDGAKNLPSDFVRIPPSNKYIDPNSEFFPAPKIDKNNPTNVAMREYFARMNKKRGVPIIDTNPTNIALREYFARMNKERGAHYNKKDLIIHPDIHLDPDYIKAKKSLGIKHYEPEGAKNLPPGFVRIPQYNNRYIDPNSDFFPAPKIDKNNPTNVAMREYFDKINQERGVPIIDTNPTNIALREYFARMNKDRGAPYNKKDLIINPDIHLDPDYIKAKKSLGIKHYEPEGAKNLPPGFVRIPHNNRYIDPNSKFFPAPTISDSNPTNVAMREYFDKFNQERGVVNPSIVNPSIVNPSVKLGDYLSSDFKKYISDINKINLKKTKIRSRKISKNNGVNLIAEFISSPKRHSPKIRSPTRHSPKIRSPKIRSPKIRSPKRRSPKRRSPKRRSPKRR
jgi:hypothetical protein